MSNCIFCNLPLERIVHEYKHFYVIRDAFPVTPLHSLIITKRHVVSYFQCSKAELKYLDNKIRGYNIGMNIGEDAGQSIFHCHIHIIPRREDDTPNPRGGIRGVIPEKQNY